MKNNNVTNEQWRAIDEALDEVIGGMRIEDKEQLIANRKHIIHAIIEQYCTWTKDFDCLPDIMQIGAYNPRYLAFRQVDIKGKTIKNL